MVIVLRSQDLMRRVRLATAWKNAGHQVIDKPDPTTMDLIVVDLSHPNAIQQIKQDRHQYPTIKLLAFGPHTNLAALQNATAAGAHQAISQGKIVEHVLRIE
jgi:DNA-binding NarL/FixJ family response regulator